MGVSRCARSHDARARDVTTPRIATWRTNVACEKAIGPADTMSAGPIVLTA
jgi:hypothetical protein